MFREQGSCEVVGSDFIFYKNKGNFKRASKVCWISVVLGIIIAIIFTKLLPMIINIFLI